jgi:hypothetical protein
MRWRSYLYTASLIVGGLLFGWQLVLAGQAVSAEALQVDRLWLAGVAAITLIVGTAFQITAWIVVMRDLGVPLGWLDGMRGYVLPFLARYIPGLVWGYLNRTHWLNTRFGTAPALANAGSVIEVLGLITSAAIVVVLGGAWWGATDLVGGGVVLLLLVASVIVLVRGFARWPQPERPTWLVKGVQSVRAATSPVTVVRVARTVPWYLVLWLSYGLVVWLSLGLVTVLDLRDLPASTLAFAAAWLVGFLVIILPAGLGLRESALTALLMMFFGLAQPAAALVAVFTRAYILVAELAYVVWGVAGARRSPDET